MSQGGTKMGSAALGLKELLPTSDVNAIYIDSAPLKFVNGASGDMSENIDEFNSELMHGIDVMIYDFGDDRYLGDEKKAINKEYQKIKERNEDEMGDFTYKNVDGFVHKGIDGFKCMTLYLEGVN